MSAYEEIRNSLSKTDSQVEYFLNLKLKFSQIWIFKNGMNNKNLTAKKKAYGRWILFFV